MFKYINIHFNHIYNIHVHVNMYMYTYIHICDMQKRECIATIAFSSVPVAAHSLCT